MEALSLRAGSGLSRGVALIRLLCSQGRVRVLFQGFESPFKGFREKAMGIMVAERDCKHVSLRGLR